MTTFPKPMAIPASPAVAMPSVARSQDVRARRWRRLLAALLIVIAALVVANVLVGVGNVLTPAEAWRALTSDDGVPRLHELAVNLRLPRALLAILAGIALGAAGALLQALTRNPLASPDITGVSQGALAVVVAWTAFGPSLPYELGRWMLPVVATLGGLASAAVVYLLTRRSGSIESSRLILIGILVGGVLSSCATLSLIFLGADADRLLGFLAGSLALKQWQDAIILASYTLPGLLLLVLAVPRANALQLGDDVAVSIGQRRERDRLIVLLAAVTLTAGVVSVVGAIGFVGLIGPHMVRRFVGSDLRRLIPAAAIAGAAMVLAADLVARNVQPARLLLSLIGSRLDYSFEQLPVGMYLTFFGVPFLISLLWRRSR